MMESDAYSTLLVKQSGSVLEVTLNRPEVRNALDETLIAELTRCVTAATNERTARALILRGAGASFCAGADLNWMARAAAYTYEENLEDARALQRMFAALAHFPGVTIAAAHGAAIGGGAGLVAVCDIAVAVEPATFSFSEVRLGLIPALIAPYVIEKVGVGVARALFVSGERFDAEMGFRINLLQHRVRDPRDTDALLRSIIAPILQAGPDAIAAAKQLIRDIASKTPDEAADLTAECIARLRAGPEGQEGIHAFLEKRKPDFARTLPGADPTA